MSKASPVKVRWLGLALLAVPFSVTPPLLAGDYVWDAGGDGTNWANAANWDLDSGYPDDAADTALINIGGTSLTVPSNAVLGALTLDGAYTGTVTLAGNLTLDDGGGASGALTVNAGRLQTGKDLLSGIAADGAFSIGTGGTVIVRRRAAAAGTHGVGQALSAASLSVAGLLQADGQGFDGGGGPGVGNWYDGGSHGGRGSDYQNNWAAPTYGSFVNPTALGSGGGPGGSNGGGGGALLIAVSGGVTVDGTLSANGANAVNMGDGSGGSGGSVNITAASLSGSGVIRANGGSGSTYSSGGGGRIAFAISGSDTFSGTIEAKGGGGATGRRGTAGTIWLSQSKRDNLTLGGAGNMTALRLGSDDTMGPGKPTNYVFGAVTLEANGTLEVDCVFYTNVVNGRYEGYSAVLQVNTLDVRTNGVLSADGLGFYAGLSAGSGGYLDGGSHGGRGGQQTGVAPTYGSFTNPIAAGSGGSTSRGGGAVLVNASGAVTVNGTVTANGALVTDTGGSGGSVLIRAPSLAGNGVIRANGASPTTYGCGGGGRVALWISGTDAFAGAVEARGGGSVSNNSAYRGFAGTVFLSAARRENLTLGGDGNMAALRLGTDDTMGPTGANAYVFGTITVESNGLLEVDGQPYTNVLTGKAQGWAARVRAGTIEVKPGGVVSASSLGNGGGRGAGAATGHVDGGSHGGRGGFWAGIGATYGSAIDPVTLGSGGSGAGSSAGGALLLEATNAFTLNGTVRANGLDRGSGGTVNILARQLAGSGAVQANGGVFSADIYGNGGGGRIAVRLTQGTDFGNVSFAAIGGTNGQKGAAGTVYLQHAGQAAGEGIVRVSNPHAVSTTNIATEVPSRLAPAAWLTEFGKATLVATNRGVIGLSTNVTVGDLYLAGTSSSLVLNGWTLTVNTPYHPDWGSTGRVVYAGGKIVWKPRKGALIQLR